jgi:hypothetical protein
MAVDPNYISKNIPNFDPNLRLTLAEWGSKIPAFAQVSRQYIGDQLNPDEGDRADPWQVYTLADAYAPRPPVEYVAANLFALPSLNIVYAPPGTLKSMLMADLAICAAGGIDWLPPASWITNGGQATAIKTVQAPTMWLDFDNGRRRTHDRIAALARARNLPEDAQIYYYSMPSPWLQADDKGSIGALSLRIQSLNAKLVIIDNLGVVSGDADENSGEMVTVMSHFRQVAEETGAAIVLIHHQRKGNGTIGRAGDNLRGHSSIEASLDLALNVDREELADTVTIKATKNRGADVLPFSAVFTYEDDPAGELMTAKFYGIVTEDTKSGAAIEREILAALYGSALNKTDLKKAVKEALPDVGVVRISDFIDRLAANGKLKVSSGKNNTEKIYSRL